MWRPVARPLPLLTRAATAPSVLLTALPLSTTASLLALLRVLKNACGSILPLLLQQ